jgi:nucleotide-binding universal stress UspA family protein
MYEKILVPLDGSKRAEMIRPHVKELASRFQATVILIMVIEYMYADGIGGPYTGISMKSFNAKLKESEACLNKFAPKLQSKGIACKTLIALGPVVEKIIEAAESEDADLIAMTSHGRGGLPASFTAALRPVF